MLLHNTLAFFHLDTGAQIFAGCTGGDGSNSNLNFFLRISKQKRGVYAGKKLIYGARLRNTANVSLPTPLEFSVTLPDGVALLNSKSAPEYRYRLPSSTLSRGNHKGKAHDKRLLSDQGSVGKGKIFNTTTPLEATFNSTLRTLTWHDLTFPPRKGYAFTFKVRVFDDVPAGTDLVFSASFYAELPATGQPYCSRAPG